MATKKTKTKTIVENQIEQTEVQTDNNSSTTTSSEDNLQVEQNSDGDADGLAQSLQVETKTTEDSADSDVPIEQKEVSPKEASANEKEGEQSTKKETSQKDSHTTKCEQLAKKYSKVYPNETEFHITSDYQVFLGEGRSYAQNHQRTQKSGELVTIKVK